MYAEGWRRPVYVLLFVAMCCPQSWRFWAFGRDRSQVDNSAAHATSARNEDSTKRARELFRQGADLIEKDRFAAAIPLLRQAADLDPQEARIHHYLGYALWKTRQWSAASAEFETAHKLEPGNPYTEYFQARIAYSEGHLDRAVQLYEAAVASGNPVFDTYQRLGQAYSRQGEHTKALDVTRLALQQAPWDGAIHYQLGKIYRQMGRSKEAQQEFESSERAKRVDQVSIQKLLELSGAIREKKIDRALELRGELLSHSSPDPETLIWLGTLLGQGALYREALQPLRQAAEINPNSFEALYNLGLTLVKLEQYEEAETKLKKALQARPDSFEANTVLAVLYVNQNRNREAIEGLRAAAKAKPGDPKVTGLLGEQYLQGRYLDEAIGTLQEAVRLKPDDLRLRYLLIDAYQKDQDYEKALNSAREALALFPHEARTHFEAGQQLVNLGHYREARPFFEDAIRVDPSFKEAYNSLGDLSLRSGEYQKALESFEKARSLDPQDLLALRGLGQSLIRLKQYEAALAELQKSIQSHPDDAELYFELSQVYTRLGSREKATEAVAVFQKLHAKETERQDLARKRSFEAGVRPRATE